jgi:threonylcarbamoyladenosine tRNA methylthiotransferase MtaB
LYDDFDSNFEDMYIEKFNTRTRAFVKVQDGCENFCSYCIIPKVRGKCRSKKLDVAVKEVQTLVNNGYKEIILTGIHTGNYGVDIGTNFAALLKELVKIEGLKRLRISSIEATELTDEVLEVIKNNPVIVDHFHIPIQSGSDNVLKLMNRKYNIEQFKNVVKKIRDFYPLASITTDIISGHPGENKDEFEETLKNVKEINFSKLHVFPYSERRDTPSSKFPQIPEYLKKEETDTLLKLSYELEVAYMKKFLGMKLDVLFETQKDGYSYGHTSNYLSVKVVGNIKSSTFETVTLINVEYPYIFGEVERDTEPVEENDELE